MLSPEEIGLLGNAARQDRVLDQYSFAKADGVGGTIRLSLWNHPTDTIYGMIARSESLVSCAEKLLGGEVYHYHSNMESHHPRYTPSFKVPDTAILEAGLKRFKDSDGAAAAWLNPESDYSAVQLEKHA
jgi:hypothetical protein